MVIKSGEGVVILTRPQKFSQSSSPSTKHKDSNKQQLEASYLHPDFTAQAHQNRRQYTLMPCRSGQSNELK